eukprot:2080645-Amphidinium_carterae.1
MLATKNALIEQQQRNIDLLVKEENRLLLESQKIAAVACARPLLELAMRNEHQWQGQGAGPAVRSWVREHLTTWLEDDGYYTLSALAKQLLEQLEVSESDIDQHDFASVMAEIYGKLSADYAHAIHSALPGLYVMLLDPVSTAAAVVLASLLVKERLQPAPVIKVVRKTGTDLKVLPVTLNQANNPVAGEGQT